MNIQQQEWLDARAAERDADRQLDFKATLAIAAFFIVLIFGGFHWAFQPQKNNPPLYAQPDAKGFPQ